MGIDWLNSYSLLGQDTCTGDHRYLEDTVRIKCSVVSATQECFRAVSFLHQKVINVLEFYFSIWGLH